MICNCPTCATALYFDPATNKMKCIGCGNFYDVDESTDDLKLEQKYANKNTSMNSDTETMDCNIYTCTACGAELAINGVESATFCAYCGQPTIVFDRVSSKIKPKYILPFSVSRESAIISIQNRLASGMFVPDEIKHFEIERVRGIYIPFWLYDVYYHDRQYLSGEVKQGKSTVTKYYYRDAECSFHDLTVDASKQLSDESSQRLEPYHARDLLPFDVGYLSGFYADCYDMNADEMAGTAIFRTKELFDAEVQKTIRADDIKLLKSEPECYITNRAYAMFPAWFLTFRYQNEPYTILVNGQTGKLIGAVPFNKKKVSLCFMLLGIFSSFFATLITYVLTLTESEDGYELIIFLLVIAGTMFASGHKKFKAIRTSIDLSRSNKMNTFVKDRQDETR